MSRLRRYHGLPPELTGDERSAGSEAGECWRAAGDSDAAAPPAGALPARGGAWDRVPGLSLWVEPASSAGNRCLSGTAATYNVFQKFTVWKEYAHTKNGVLCSVGIESNVTLEVEAPVESLSLEATLSLAVEDW